MKYQKMMTSFPILASNELAVPISTTDSLYFTSISCKGRGWENLLHLSIPGQEFLLPKPLHHQFIVIGLVYIITTATLSKQRAPSLLFTHILILSICIQQGKLCFIERTIFSTLYFHQLVMVSSFNYGFVTHNEDFICVSDGGESMGYNK